ncbi:basic secretory protein-like protein [Actinophytocola sediminis]
MTNRAGPRTWLGAAIAAVLLLGIAVVSLPGTGQPPSPGPGRPLGAVSPQPRADLTRADAVTALLDRRARAVQDHDERAFLATIDPEADPAFLTTQRRLFDNLAGVTFDEWAYHLKPHDTLDVTDLPDEAAAGADEVWAPGVDLRYALRGGDVTPTSRAMGYLFARHGDAWYLRSDNALDRLGRRSWRGPWDFGPCVVTTTRKGIVVSHPGDEPMVRRLVGELDSSVLAVSELWPTSWSERVVLMLPDSPSEMRALVGAKDFPVDAVVAVAVADRVDNATRSVTGQRVVLSPTAVRALSATSLRVVLRHEITHVAARADTVDGSPTWLLEGFADYVGYRDSGVTLADGAPDLMRAVRADRLPSSLPEDRAFRMSGPDLDQAYQESWSLARFIAAEYGEPGLIELYRTLASAGAVSARETDDLLRDVLGLDRAELVRGWREYLLAALE